MIHKNGRVIYGVSLTELREHGGAWVAPVTGKGGVHLVGCTKRMPGSGWMSAANVLIDGVPVVDDERAGGGESGCGGESYGDTEGDERQ